MSLSSFLLGANVGKSKDKGKAIDNVLDDLFRTTAVPPTAKPAITTSKNLFEPSEKKRKLPEEPAPSKSKKKAKSNVQGDASKVAATIARSEKASGSVPTPKKSKQPVQDPESNDDGSEEETPVHAESEEVESDEEGDPTKLVHESLNNGSKTRSSTSKAKYVPADESPERRDARTIFVGNVLVDVVKNRPLQKQFKRHILSFVPSAKIESIRFRSVAFQKPTTELPPIDGSLKDAKPNPKEIKDGRQHDRERAASWRASKSNEDEEKAADAGKSFLTPGEKKRVAFIKQEIHSGVDSVNAYVVFAHAPAVDQNRPKNLPPPNPTMDPYEAARTAVKEADGSVFMGRTIRVDSAVKGKEKGAADAEMAGDPKATVFVGNLDFASKEEDLRAFFEALMVQEKGAPGEGDEEDEEGEEGKGKEVKRKSKAWVRRVRIIRDKDTLLGKGFGYVQFTNRECVDEILALEQDRLKFAKRKLRVQRCKTLPGGTKANIKSTGPKPTNVQGGKFDRAPTRRPPGVTPITVPKGDPTLGTKIASLSKDERKQVKATDADRVARRLAKKKAKALAEKGVKAREGDRDRIRKRFTDKKGGASTTEKSKKRVRSNKALSKMNTKK